MGDKEGEEEDEEDGNDDEAVEDEEEESGSSSEYEDAEGDSSGGSACSEYRVDTLAAVFGACKCGLPKAAHAPSALTHGKPSSSRRSLGDAGESEKDNKFPHCSHRTVVMLLHCVQRTNR